MSAPRGPVAKRRHQKRQRKLRHYADLCTQVSTRDGNVCRICWMFARQPHHHHIVFRSRGGQDTPENLIIVCPQCHTMIHDHKLEVEGTSSQLMISRRVDERGEV